MSNLTTAQWVGILFLIIFISTCIFNLAWVVLAFTFGFPALMFGLGVSLLAVGARNALRKD